MKYDIVSRAKSISARVSALKRRKSQLEDKISAEQARPAPDHLRLRRLKSRKLVIKDQVARYDSLLRSLKPLAGHVAARKGAQTPC